MTYKDRIADWYVDNAGMTYGEAYAQVNFEIINRYWKIYPPKTWLAKIKKFYSLC